MPSSGVSWLRRCGRTGRLTIVQSGKRTFKLAQQPVEVRPRTVAQGKPVVRRGRKARDLSETARLPTQQIRLVPPMAVGVLRCPE